MILLADNSLIYQRMITDHLREWGFDFVIARDGKEAWKLLERADPFGPGSNHSRDQSWGCRGGNIRDR